MDIIDIKQIIEKNKEENISSSRTLKAIEKLINSHVSIDNIIKKGYDEMKINGDLQKIQEETDFFIKNRKKILVDMVQSAFYLLTGESKEEMIKWLDENFDIYPISKREKQLKK